MSQLLPALLLILLLISPVYAVEPYEALCTSEQDFRTDAVLTDRCYGNNAKACTDAGGTYGNQGDMIAFTCYGIDSDTPDKCGELTGFTYIHTCGDFGAYLSVPDNAARLLDCSSEFAFYLIPGVQFTCCGGEGNQKRVCNSAIIIPMLYSVSAIIYLVLGIYGFRVLKADWAQGKKTEKASVLRLTIITASI